MGKERTFYFIGVTTASSSIMRIFPRWMEAIGRADVVIKGIDIKIHSEPEVYRQVIRQIKQEDQTLGGLVTTHKIDLFQAAYSLFDDFDEYARICGEISSISKLDGRLQGHARDPISSGLSLNAILGEAYFGRTGGHVLFLGAGGAATATVLHLLMKTNPADRPRQILLVDRLQERLDRLRKMVEGFDTDITFRFICNQETARNDQIMQELPAGSVVINATGMGKDTPGSPITEKGVFPYQGVAWEFNYRGELGFYRCALAQADQRKLKVEDGWFYFLHGWTQVIGQVLHIDIDQDIFSRFETIAYTFRSGG
jgi:shikimate dehydrogenase